MDMNTSENTAKNVSGRNIRSVLLSAAWFAVCLFAVACAKIVSDEDFEGNRPEDALVRLTVSMPQAAFPREDTKAADESGESLIRAVKILVFEQEDDRYAFRYMAEGERVESVGNTTRFEARLLGTPNPVKLMLAGNYGDAFLNYAPSPGDAEDAVKMNMGRSFADMEGNLPMYGEVAIPSGLQTDEENSFNVKMLRAVARIDVVKLLDADSRPFRIESVRLYRPNDKIRIAPSESVSTEFPRVTEPSVFQGAAMSGSPVKAEITGTDPVSVTGIYAPEAEGKTDPAMQLTGVTCLVVGGYYDGQTQPSYYRIDFDSGLEGHPFGQILRNYKYVFQIKKVTGPGWSDPDAAAVNRATSIVAQVEAWEDFTIGMYFEGENYFGVSARTLKLGYLAGRTGNVDVQATLPYTIQWLDGSGNPTGTAVSGVGAALPENNGFTVAIGQGSGSDRTVSRLVFSTVRDNRTKNDVTARLRVTAGRWTLEIAVTQESPEKYRQRIVRVLSVTEIGDLGTNTPSSASGLPLRRILDNAKNFSADGTVVVGGFSFSEVSRSEMQATGTGSVTDKEIFRSMQGTINAQDVIYLTYNTPISDELARVVLAWLQGSVNRVLIVGTDTDATNAKLRQYLKTDGTWKYYYQNNIGGSFKRAAQTDANKRFFTSPFGQVAENAAIVRADDYAGYCSDYPSTVAPLVVSSVAGQDKTMIVGVNLKSRIVYQGDASLHQYDRLSSQANSNGTITTDFDRLTANLWAWIVEQVCAGS